jgi:hypothetical protein
VPSKSTLSSVWPCARLNLIAYATSAGLINALCSACFSRNFDGRVAACNHHGQNQISADSIHQAVQKAIFGTRRVLLESKKIAYESLVLSLLLYGSECWVVSAENMRLLQRFHRKCIRIMCRVTRHHTPH